MDIACEEDSFMLKNQHSHNADADQSSCRSSDPTAAILQLGLPRSICNHL
jgi:hypothetical protein